MSPREWLASCQQAMCVAPLPHRALRSAQSQQASLHSKHSTSSSLVPPGNKGVAGSASRQAAGVRAAPLHGALPHGRLHGGVPRGGAEKLRLRPHAARGALRRAAAVRRVGCCCVPPKALSRVLTWIDKGCSPSGAFGSFAVRPTHVRFGLHGDRLLGYFSPVASPEGGCDVWCSSWGASSGHGMAFSHGNQHTAKSFRSPALALCIHIHALLRCPLFHASAASRCERRCQAMRACGRHQCKRRCCDGSACGACDQPCGRRLRCDNHVCPAPCHAGPCQPCPLTATVACACGGTSYAVPCGSEVHLCTCTSCEPEATVLPILHNIIALGEKEFPVSCSPVGSACEVAWVGCATCLGDQDMHKMLQCTQYSAIIMVVTLQCVTSRREPLQPCALTLGIRPSPTCSLHSP